MKVLLIGVLILSVLVWTGVAKAQNVTLSNSFNIPLTVGSTEYTFTVPASTSFDSMTVGSTSVTVTIPAGSIFMLESSNRFQFRRVGGPDNAFLFTCETDASRIRVTATAGTGSITTTITPGTPPCDPTPSGSGFTPAPPAAAPAPAPTPTPTSTPLTTPPPITPPAPVVKKPEPKKEEKKVVKKAKKVAKKKVAKKKVVKKAKKVVKKETKVTKKTKATKKTVKKSTKKTAKKPTKAKASKVSTQPKTGYTFTKFLSSGSSGEEVRQLQLKLQAMGFLAKDVTPNGYFGPATTQAVKDLQKAYGLDTAGYVGPGTRDVLNK
jgi:hypothetical protein